MIVPTTRSKNKYYAHLTEMIIPFYAHSNQEALSNAASLATITDQDLSSIAIDDGDIKDIWESNRGWLP